MADLTPYLDNLNQADELLELALANLGMYKKTTTYATRPYDALRVARLAVQKLEDVCRELRIEGTRNVMPKFDAAIAALKVGA